MASALSSSLVSAQQLAASLRESLQLVQSLNVGLKECRASADELRLLELSTLGHSIPAALSEATLQLAALSTQTHAILAALPSHSAASQRQAFYSASSDADSDMEAEDLQPVLPPWFDTASWSRVRGPSLLSHAQAKLAKRRSVSTAKLLKVRPDAEQENGTGPRERKRRFAGAVAKAAGERRRELSAL